MTTHLPPDLARLPIPCPPPLVTALGFERSTRFAGIFRSHVTGDPVWMDSRRIAHVNEGPFRSLLEHPSVRDSLADFNLGSLGEEADHWLLADRSEEVLFVGPAALVAGFLRPLAAADGASTRWTTSLEEMRTRLRAQPGGASEQQRATDALEEEARQRLLANRLTSWLDGQAPNET